MKHPAHYYIKTLILQDPGITDQQLKTIVGEAGYISPTDDCLINTRQELSPQPANLDTSDKLHRPSMKYLRDQEIYDLFFPTPAVKEAFEILSDPHKRQAIEQVLLNPELRNDVKTVIKILNKKNKWLITEDGVLSFYHFFWNTKLLTIDQWSKYLYEKTTLYDRYMGLIKGSPQLAFFHLRLDQSLDSKNLIRRAQEIAYFTLEEVNQQSGALPDKVKSIGILTRAITDCHEALSTSDMALTGVLQEFEKWRMDRIEVKAPDIK